MNTAPGLRPQPPFLPEDAWEECRSVAATLLRYFATPQELLEREAITPHFRSQILRWLRPLEHLVRLLILIMAKAIRLAPMRTRARKKRQRPPRAFKPRFSWPRAPSPTQERKPPPPSPPREAPVVIVSKPLAERLEGAIRVIENPEAAARRLARRLKRRPQAARSVLNQKPPDPESDIPLRHSTRAAHAHTSGLYETPTPNDSS